MIIDTLANADRYMTLHPLFPQAFAYLRSTDLRALPTGQHAIRGKDIFAIVESTSGRSRNDAKLESHRQYIDIQLVLEGCDEMGWKPLNACHDTIAEYRTDHDIQFFGDMPNSWITTPAGSFCLFFPEDAHAPLVSEGNIRKIILKIAVNGISSN